MFDSITVRKITKNDKSKYFEMSRRFYEAGVTNSKITDEGREKFFKEILSGEIVRGYFMCFNGQVAGYAVCALSASQEACGRVLWLDELYVDPEYRGKGVGTELFKFLEAGTDYDYVRLEVEKDNARAMKLYRSLGFKNAEYISLYKKTAKR